jgi:hypothetical protein
MMQLGVYLCEVDRCCATIARSYHSSLMRVHYLCAVAYLQISLSMSVVRIAEVVNDSSCMGHGEPQDGNQSMVQYIFRPVDDQEASSSSSSSSDSPPSCQSREVNVIEMHFFLAPMKLGYFHC